MTGRHRVRVADDVISLPMLMRQALEVSGLDVVEAENGTQALERFENHKPNVIRSDVVMPNMDGFEVWR